MYRLLYNFGRDIRFYDTNEKGMYLIRQKIFFRFVKVYKIEKNSKKILHHRPWCDIIIS